MCSFIGSWTWSLTRIPAIPWLFWAWLVCIRSLQLKQWCQITSMFICYFVGWYWWIRSTKPLDFWWCTEILRDAAVTKKQGMALVPTVLDGFGITAFFQTSDHSWIRLLLHFGGNRWQPFRLTQIYHNGGVAMWNPVLPNGSKMFKMIFIMIFKNDCGKIMWFIIIPT